jgi:hypothetical protein
MARFGYELGVNFLRRIEPVLWALSWPVLASAIVGSSVAGLRWLMYLFIGLAVVDLVTFHRRMRWVRGRHAARG